MDAARIAARMRSTPATLRAVTEGLARADAPWRPEDGAWSILEVVCHMADEESEDFRPRLESTLRDPAAPWPALDLDRVAERRRYNERDLSDAVEVFASTREVNLIWLDALLATRPDWSKAYRHPKAGVITAADLMVSWAAHDALHLRQIAKRLFQLARRDGAGAASDYAGEWRA